MAILELLRQPWPWYFAGPAIGLFVPALLLLGNKSFGFSSNLEHLCAMAPRSPFQHDVRRSGWSLLFALGTLLGGFVAGVLLADPEPLRVASSTARDLEALGVPVDGRLVPLALFDWSSLATLPGFAVMVLGGFLVGFGTRYAGGCTSGHAITGLAHLQLPSLVAVVGFFVGGMIGTFVLLPLILGG